MIITVDYWCIVSGIKYEGNLDFDSTSKMHHYVTVLLLNKLSPNDYPHSFNNEKPHLTCGEA